jgi:hypoxanthine phosphoribosyltransferase
MMRQDSLRPFISRQRIAARVSEIGQCISQDFAGEPVILIGVLKGAAMFLADLARHVTLDATFDFIAVSSYAGQQRHSGEVKLVKDVDESLAGRNVVLVEDILDTGLTLTYLRNLFLARSPQRLKIAVLIDKPSRRIQPVAVDYVGFAISDEFVAGYGTDFAERYRNLPDICIMESSSKGV